MSVLKAVPLTGFKMDSPRVLVMSDVRDIHMHVSVSADEARKLAASLIEAAERAEAERSAAA